VGVPALFLVGILLVPLSRIIPGGIPSVLAILIVILGAGGIVVAYETLRTKEQGGPKGKRKLSGMARLTIVGVLAFIMLYVLIFVFTGQSQT